MNHLLVDKACRLLIIVHGSRNEVESLSIGILRGLNNRRRSDEPQLLFKSVLVECKIGFLVYKKLKIVKNLFILLHIRSKTLVFTRAIRIMLLLGPKIVVVVHKFLGFDEVFGFN